jgi:hypothetical protein
MTFRELVERVIQQLEGAYALVFMSTHYPGEAVATRCVSLCTAEFVANKLNRQQVGRQAERQTGRYRQTDTWTQSHSLTNKEIDNG